MKREPTHRVGADLPGPGLSPVRLAAAVLLLVLGALGSASRAGAQVVTNPNQVVGTIRFTNTNPDVLALLNGPEDDPPGADLGLRRCALRATAQPPAPELTAATNAPAATATSAPYELTVEAGTPGEGNVYELAVTATMGAGRYRFQPVLTPPVEIEPAPDVEVDLAECLALAHVTFTDESGTPVTPRWSADVYQETTPGSGVFDRKTGGGSSEWLAVPGDGLRVLLRFDYSFGTDSCQDTWKRSESVIITPECDEIVDVPIETRPLALGRVVGIVDVLGEDEHHVPPGVGCLTSVTAAAGPYGNRRCDRLERSPSSGAYELPNLVESAAVDPPLAYSLTAEVSFRRFRRYERLQLPRFSRSNGGGVTVLPGETTDMTDVLVVDPAYIRGDILLVAPPVGDSPASAVLADLQWRPDTDGDGIPERWSLVNSTQSIPELAPRSVFVDGPGSTVRATGQQTPASGATLSASGGGAVALFDGAFDPRTGVFSGDYELVVGGLRRGPSRWNATTLELGVLDHDTPWDAESFHDFALSIAPSFPASSFELQPGEAAVAPLHYCLTNLVVRFRAGAGAFNHPRVAASGVFDGVDFEGRDIRYTVNLRNGDGVPYGDQPHGTSGFVTVALPQGEYELSPSVVQLDPSGGESLNELAPFALTVGCRQRVVVSTDLQLEIDNVAPCSPNRLLHVTGRVRGEAEVREVTVQVNGGPPETVCAPCGVSPDLAFDVVLESCLNSVLVTARDVAGNEASVTSFTRHVGEPLSLTGCEDRTIERAGGAAGATVTFDVTAADACDIEVPVTCEPPSGSWFPDGDTEVRCIAEADCGAEGDCTFEVHVEGPPPVADAGPDRAACAARPVRIGGAPTASSGDPPYVIAWAPATGLDDPALPNPTATPTAVTTYTVTVTDSRGQVASDSMTVTLLPEAPEAAFSGPDRVCEGQEVCFVDESIGAIAWAWDFGTDTGDASAEASPCFAFPEPGSFTVTLTAIGPCGTSEASQVVTVDPRPRADFSHDVGRGGCVGRPVDFIDLSTENPTSWQWDFGDGSVSLEQHPSHLYARDGVFIVSLVACNDCGCSPPHFDAVSIAAACNTNCEANSNQIACATAPAEVSGNTCLDHDNFNTTSYPCAPDHFYSGDNKIHDLNFLAGSNFLVRLVETEPEPNGYDLDLMLSVACNPPACAAWGEDLVVFDDRTATNDDYWLIVDGRDGTCGPYRLEVECLDPRATASCAAPEFAGLAAAEDEDPCVISGILVTWDAASSWGRDRAGASCASGRYEVWRTDIASGEQVLVGSSLTGTSFLDGAAVPDRAYRYRVHAVNECCGEPTVTAAWVEAVDRFTDRLAVTAGPDRVLDCDQAAGVRLFGRVTEGSGAGLEISWEPAAAVTDPATLSPHALTPGTYVLTVRDRASGCTATDEVEVALHPRAAAAEPSALDRGDAPPLTVARAPGGGLRLAWEDLGPGVEYRLFEAALAVVRAGGAFATTPACSLPVPEATILGGAGARCYVACALDCEDEPSSAGRSSLAAERPRPTECP